MHITQYELSALLRTCTPAHCNNLHTAGAFGSAGTQLEPGGQYGKTIHKQINDALATKRTNSTFGYQKFRSAVDIACWRWSIPHACWAAGLSHTHGFIFFDLQHRGVQGAFFCLFQPVYYTAVHNFTCHSAPCSVTTLLFSPCKLTLISRPPFSCRLLPPSHLHLHPHFHFHFNCSPPRWPHLQGTGTELRACLSTFSSCL